MIIIKAIDKYGSVKFKKIFKNTADVDFTYRLCKIYKTFATVDKVIIEEPDKNIITEFED